MFCLILKAFIHLYSVNVLFITRTSNLNSDLIFFPYITVDNDKEPINLMNLKPTTPYRIRVQLSRPGEGGEGALGPEAIMETDCPGESAQN